MERAAFKIAIRSIRFLKAWKAPGIGELEFWLCKGKALTSRGVQPLSGCSNLGQLDRVLLPAYRDRGAIAAVTRVGQRVAISEISDRLDPDGV